MFDTRIDPGSDTFQKSRDAMVARLEEVRRLEQRVRDNSARAEAKFRERGQLLPRERLTKLLDPGAPVLELSTLAGLGMHDDDGDVGASGGGLITAIGVVEGVRVLALVNDSAIKGGSTSPMGLKKSLRAQAIALENHLPLVTLSESGGANLLYQSEIFIEGGRIFCNMARLSAAGIPQITVVHGSNTAGGAYVPGLSDYVIMVRGRAKVFLAGPPLVKAAIGQDATDEELGGAEMHAAVSGLCEYLADDDAHAIALARQAVAQLGWPRSSAPASSFSSPKYDAGELLGVVPIDPRKPYDVREIIARITDGSEFFDFKPKYGAHTVCGHGQIEGRTVGLVGNNGPIDERGATKVAQFIQLCCQSGTPIVYLQNTTGYMVGREAERGGIVKHGAKMIQAVSNATVPQVTVIVGGSFGAGNYGMCGRSFDPRFLFAWPNARIGVMGSDQAARVMGTIAVAKAQRAGVAIDAQALESMQTVLRDKMEAESTGLFASAHLWDDGIIDPRETRRVLAIALATAVEGDSRRPRASTYGVARF